MPDPIQTAKPEAVGLSSARLQRLDDHFRTKFIEPGLIPGAQILVHRRGQIAHFSSLGQADRERGTALSDDTVFRIYSMTKPLTSVLFMMLVEEGKVALDDPVSSLIPGWEGLGVYTSGELGAFQTRPADSAMRMVDLLRHTSGLTYAFQNRTPIDAAYTSLGIGALKVQLDLEASINAMGTLPLEFSPGTLWNYSVATDVLGHLIGVIEGRPFEDVLKARLIDPLGMVDTDFQTSAANAGRLAACYAIEPGVPTFRQDDPQTSAYLSPPRFVSGGGGLVSTSADYLRFCRMMLNGGELDGVRYLSPKTVRLMTVNHLPGGKDLAALSVSLFSEAAYAGVGFGLGYAVIQDPARMLLAGTAGSYFWGGAASTYFWIDPAEDLIVIFMTQLLGGGVLPMRRDLRTLVYAAVEDSLV